VKAALVTALFLASMLAPFARAQSPCELDPDLCDTGRRTGGFIQFDINGGGTTIQDLIDMIADVINSLIPIVFTLGLLAFFWGIVKYIYAQGSEKAEADGKKIMLWGLVALFVMSSVWGIVRLAQETLGIDPRDNRTITIPEVQDYII
jgi:hypothetical protein